MKEDQVAGMLRLGYRVNWGRVTGHIFFFPFSGLGTKAVNLCY